MKKTIFAIIICICLIFSVTVCAYATEVKLGGMPFGIKFNSQSLVVSGFNSINTNEGDISPALNAGIKKGDIICKINGKNPTSAEALTETVTNSKGEEIIISVLRDGQEKSITVKPKISLNDKNYKIGLVIKEGSAGIGTVTYISKDNSFAGLGHGICETESGELVKISNAAVFNVTVSDVVKGTKGAPGELHGIFSPKKIGVAQKNTDTGVYGILSEAFDTEDKTIETGEYEEGEASIFTTVSSAGRCEYSCEIKNNTNSDGKTFSLTVTDPELLKITGGIVQGMSGSPIVQNGKLVGAVTHVLINDPAKGYGIAIEEMINEGIKLT